jgi:hypothetical protein
MTWELAYRFTERWKSSVKIFNLLTIHADYSSEPHFDASGELTPKPVLANPKFITGGIYELYTLFYAL